MIFETAVVDKIPQYATVSTIPKKKLRASVSLRAMSDSPDMAHTEIFTDGSRVDQAGNGGWAAQAKGR
jgi:hypothetical protein